MTSPNKILAVNQVIESYFNSNKDVEQVLAKDLMPQFIAKGIFNADRKGGLPIREILRQLDGEKKLDLIPYVLPVRKQAITNWYFIRSASGKPLIPVKQSPKPVKAQPSDSRRRNSDEAYVIDLCDSVLKLKALRQHRFDFLSGDVGKNGVSRKLPVDAYYPHLNLVIEYREPQHTKPVKHFDKPDKLTVSGVHRGEQRKIYDERRRKTLPQNGIKLVEIDYTAFSCDGRGRIIRNAEKDLDLVKNLIKKK